MEKYYAVFYPASSNTTSDTICIRTSEDLSFKTWRDLVLCQVGIARGHFLREQSESDLRGMYALKLRNQDAGVLRMVFTVPRNLTLTENILRETGFVKVQAGRMNNV